MRRLPFLGTIIGVVLLTFGLLGVAAIRSARDAQAGDLQRDVQRSATAFDAYFDRARSLNLLLAQNPVFAEPGAGPSAASPPPGRVEADHAALASALAYLQVLYPDRIGEACFIDENGRERARVVHGVPARLDELSPDERKNPFYGPTMALPVGVVYQAAPYISPDTHTLVISNSTRLQTATGGTVIVHFEISLASFLDYLPEKDRRVEWAVLDKRTKQQVLRTNPSGWTAVPEAAPSRYNSVLRATAGSGATTVGGHTGAFAQVPQPFGNANEWVVVEAALTSPTLLPEWVAAGAALIGLLVLAAALGVLRRQQRALRAAARLDNLTGLSNKLAAEDSLKEAIAAQGDTGACGILVLDLDGFKQINDTLGHHRGDEVLQEIARRLHANTLEHDVAARLGGDEFAVVVRNLSGREDVLVIARRLHQALTRPIEIEGHQRFVGASIGAALWPEHGNDAAALFRHADVAMYRAKKEHSPPQMYRGGTSDGVDELTLAAELLAGIERDEIVLHYQPLVDLRDGSVFAVEALARWMHPERGLLPPAEFIGLAERTGLIGPLTTCTLRLGLDQARRWADNGTPMRVGVNLAPQLLTEPGLADEVLMLLAERGLPGGLLALEITETAAISAEEVARSTLIRLRHAGVHIELDDFGAGYTSLHTLAELPLHTVKLDRGLLTSLQSASGGHQVLQGIVDVINGFGHEVIAEGIETAEQAELLLRVGCTRGQGYFYGRPVAADQIHLAPAAAPLVR
jgi:diguanylate cyclase (GGDEF)-like protein